MDSETIHAVVVTFEPDLDVLARLLDSLLGQVARVIIVDNSTSADPGLRNLVGNLGDGRIERHPLGANHGVARALNVGIDLARRGNATHVLLSDQDSLPAPDMVARLVEAYDRLRARGEHVGAIGPTFTDEYTGTTFPFQADVPGKFFYGHATPDRQHPHVEALSLITSGTLVPMPVLDAVGGMREDLFIDKVDIEWCHRARAAGWKLFGAGEARMFQRMGEAGLRVWFLRWRRESVYPPLRLYYQSRNYVALARQPWIQWRWKVRNGWYTLGVVYSQVVFGRQRMRALRMAVRGLADGIRGRMGPYRAG